MNTFDYSRVLAKRSVRAFTYSLLFTVLVTALGCQTQETRATSDAAQTTRTDDLMIVDCLLPGQIRKLGQNFTFVAPRRAIKTTGTDCEIRGGEYVAYDRANYSTALKIWLPEAQAGDPEAMVYVGEIYEKGLGVTADYTLAQHWYRKAAELGNTRAQINLGYLYESGLGVSRDLTEAMNWYRRASGLTGGELEFVSSVELAQREAVTRELGSLREESRELRRRLEQAEANLANNRRSLASTEREAIALRQELGRARTAATATTTSVAADPALQGELDRMVSEQQRLLATLAEQERESAQLRSELTDSQAALATERRKLAQLHVELADTQALLKAETARTTPDETRAERELRSKIESLSGRLETNRDEIVRLTGLLASSDTRNLELQQQLAARDREVAEMQRELAAGGEANSDQVQVQAELQVSQQERRRLVDQLAQVQLDAAASQRSLAQTRQELELRQRELSSAELALMQMRETLEARREGEIATTQSQFAKLRTAVAERERSLTDAKAHIAALQQSLATETQAAESRLREADEKRQALAAALQEKDGEIDLLNERLAATIRDNEKLTAVQRQLGRADAERKRLATVLAEQQLAASDLEKQLVQAEQSVTRGSAELSDMREALRLMQAELADRDRDLVAAAERAESLEARLFAQTEALDEQRREVTRLEAQMVKERAGLESQLAQALAAQNQLQRAAQDRQDRIQALEAKLLATQVTLVASERKAARLEQVEKELAEEAARVAQQEEELRKLRSELTERENDIREPAIASVVATEERGPVIEIIDPPLAATRGIPSVLLRTPVRQVELIGRVRPENELLTFKVNERPTNVDQQGLFREDVALLQPKTPVNLVAVDRLGQRTALDFVIIPSDKGAGARTQPAEGGEPVTDKGVDFGTYHALIIGNQEYEHMPDLATPINDARALARILDERYGFKTRLLINATRYEILSALNALRAELTENDNLLVFFAGHGELDNVNLRGHWLPVDAEADSSANWISNIAITDVLNVMQAKHILVIADSCYSGAMTRSSVARLETGLSPQSKIRWYRTMSKARARAVLTSGGLKPVLDAGGGDHSIFTRALLDVLAANEQILEGYGLYRKIRERVKRAAAQLNVEQDPQYAPIKYAGHEAGEFFFLPSSAVISAHHESLGGVRVARE